MDLFKPIIVANWKANKTEREVLSWLEKVGRFLGKKNKEIILCPPFVFISLLKEKLKALGFSDFIHLGAQNISHYESGSYTGEVTASQLSGLVEYSLIGHSERRRFFGEKEKDIVQKISLAKKWQIKPILLIDLPQVNEVSLYAGQEMLVCYEPVSAISTPGEYHSDDPENASKVAKEILVQNPKAIVLYGGSVHQSNAQNFLGVGFSGFVVGQASLNENDFIGLLTASFV
jgi:triosephosphate isomerase